MHPDYCFMQLWDMDDILQGSGTTSRTEATVGDSDSDEMDTDITPKSRKGIVLQHYNHVVDSINALDLLCNDKF